MSIKKLRENIDGVLLSILLYYFVYYISYGVLGIFVLSSRTTYIIINRMPLLSYEADFIIISLIIIYLLMRLKVSVIYLILNIVVLTIGFTLISLSIVGNIILLINLFLIVYIYIKKNIKILSIRTIIYFLYLILISSLVNIAITLTNIGSTVLSIQTKLRTVESALENISIVLFIINTWILLLYTLNKLFYPSRIVINIKYINMTKHYLMNSSEKSFGNKRGLLLGLLFLYLVVIYLHSPLHNPHFHPVSVDTFYYWKFLQLAEEKGLCKAISEYNLFRPVYLIFIYYLYIYFPIKNPVILFDVVVPLFSLSLLIISSYLISKKIFGREIAGYAALLTALGHTTITFIAGGFQANALALALALFLFYIYHRRLLLFTLATITMLIHPWTYVVYAFIIAFYNTFFNKLKRKKIMELYIILFSSFIIGEIIDNILVRSSPSTSLLSIAHSIITSINSPIDWIRVFQIWTWGTQAYFPINILTIMNTHYSFVSLMLSLLAPLSIIGNEIILYRFLLIIPLEIHIAKTVCRLNKKLRRIIILLIFTKTIYLVINLQPLTEKPWLNIIQS